MVNALAGSATPTREAAETASARVATADVWHALAGVADPEIPVVSIVELGIVRGIEWDGGTLCVRITPTYSGCPAMDAIREDIGVALRAVGIASYSVQTVLSPPWTTDAIAPEARARLREFGIAPPGAAARPIEVSGISPLRRRADVACPRCGSTRTRVVSQFGSTACKAQYRCEGCGEPFDHFKPF